MDITRYKEMHSNEFQWGRSNCFIFSEDNQGLEKQEVKRQDSDTADVSGRLTTEDYITQKTFNAPPYMKMNYDLSKTLLDDTKTTSLVQPFFFIFCFSGWVVFHMHNGEKKEHLHFVRGFFFLLEPYIPSEKGVDSECLPIVVWVTYSN